MIRLIKHLAQFGIALTVFWALPLLAEQATTPKSTVKDIVSTIELEKKNLEKGAAWEREESKLQDEIRHAMLELAWLEKNEELLYRYVNEANERLIELEETKLKIEQIEAELESTLLTSVDELNLFVKKDLPFLAQERTDRMEFLQDSVVDYDLGVGEKLRRVFEGFQAELGYGKNSELSKQQTITIDGQKQQVFTVRAGRIGYYAIASDKSRGWVYVPNEGFKALDAEKVFVLAEATSMMESRMFSSLAALPIYEVSSED